MRRSKASRRAGARRSRASRRSGSRRSRYGGQIMNQLPTPFNPNTATPGQVQFANAYANALSAPWKQGAADNTNGFGFIYQGMIDQNPSLQLTGQQVMQNFASYGNAASGFPSYNDPNAQSLIANPNNSQYSNFISMLQKPA